MVAAPGGLSNSLPPTLALFALMQLQHLLPLNPQGFGPVAPNVAMNTAVSFVTNTNWQSYSGEQALGYTAQMAGLAVQNFLSAAVGSAGAGVTRPRPRRAGSSSTVNCRRSGMRRCISSRYARTSSTSSPTAIPARRSTGSRSGASRRRRPR